MNRHTIKRAFTLLEVMIAVAFIGIAMLALLSLHHTDMQSVIRGQDLTKAAMLAQAVMTQAEVERFPDPGVTRGNFSSIYPGQYANFKWERKVDPSPLFPDIRRVQVRVIYGPGFANTFSITEFMHNPVPEQPPTGAFGGQAAGQAAEPGVNLNQ